MSFEFDGEKYKNASTHQKEWANKILEELKLAGNERILDLGCGDGVITNQLAEMVPDGEVLGIDASEGMIKTAKEIESNNLIFQRLDIDNITFNNQFDIIFSNATLHWVKNHNKLLNNCYKALKQHGIIRFNFASNGNCATFFNVIKEVIFSEKYKKYFNSFEWPWFMPSINEYQNIIGTNDFNLLMNIRDDMLKKYSELEKILI